MNAFPAAIESRVTRCLFTAAADATKVTTKKRLEDFMEEPMRNRDVIALAKFPDSHKRDDEAPLPIEREDWPAPAATAARLAGQRADLAGYDRGRARQ